MEHTFTEENGFRYVEEGEGEGSDAVARTLRRPE